MLDYIAYLLRFQTDRKESEPSKKPGWWAYLSTMKFAIIILILLGILSLVALFAGELRDPDALSKEPTSSLGALGRLVFILFQIDDPFRSWWYRTLVGLLSLSLLACVLERTPIIWKLWKKQFTTDISWVKNTPKNVIERNTDLSRDELTKRVAHGWKWRLKTDELWIGERAKVAMWGPLATHLGMLLIAVGALVTSFGAFTIRQGGYAGDTVSFENMPFTVRIDSFRITYYPLLEGQPVMVNNEWIGKLIARNPDSTWVVQNFMQNDNMEMVTVPAENIRNHFDNNQDRSNIQRFCSYVTVFEKGKEVEQTQIAVNSPLRRAGYRFYQSSYDPDNPRVSVNYESVTLVLEDSATGMLQTLILKPGTATKIPQDTLTVTAGQILPNFKMGSNLKAYSDGEEFKNPALELNFEGSSGYKKSKWTFLNFPMQNVGPGKYSYKLKEFKGQRSAMELATIFEIKRTYGTELLWAGFLVCSIGLILCFYFSHRVLYIEWAGPHGKEHRLIGLTRRTTQLYAQDLDRLIRS